MNNLGNPLISVIVPVYNTEKYIHNCINSILKQTLTDFELILIDDGSPDSCGVICDEYAKKDSRVKVFHQENKGVCAARNEGINNARGEYISFVDSDDYIRNNALEVLYNDITAHNADISCAGYGRPGNNVQNSRCVVWKGKEALKKSLLDNPHTYSACRKLYRKSFVGDIRFEEGRKVNEDSFFVFCCFLKQPVVVIRNMVIYHTVRNPDSASQAEFSEKFFDILYFAKKKQEIIKEKFPELQDEVNNIVIKANLSMLHTFCKTNEKKYRKDIKKCIKTVKTLKKYFVSLNSREKKFFFIVTNNLYFVYKIYYNIKHKKK